MTKPVAINPFLCQMDKPEENLQSAVSYLKDIPVAGQQVSIRHAAIAFTVSPTTLSSPLKGGHSRRQASAKYQNLSQLQEEWLVNWIIDQCSVSVMLVRAIAQIILSARYPNRLIGNNWISGFRHRHPIISSLLKRGNRWTDRSKLGKQAVEEAMNAPSGLKLHIRLD
jgi:hypothetical protein